MEQTQNIEMTTDRFLKELIELLNQNQQKDAASKVFEMAAYIDGMERKVDTVIDEIANVRKQLADMEQRQERKSLRKTLSIAVEKLNNQCQKMKQHLFVVKAEVRTKAAEIIAETKLKGKKALNRVSEFLGIKQKLEHIRQNTQESITEVDKAIGKIDAFGTGIRESMQKAANTIRIFADKPPKEYEKKKFSKTELLMKPFQNKKKLLSEVLKYTEAAVAKVEELAASVDVKQRQREAAGQEMECVEGEIVNSVPAFYVAEPAALYGAETFEAQQDKVGILAESMVKADVVNNNREKSR